MSVPDLSYVVVQVRNSQDWNNFATEADLCAYCNAVVCELYLVDANFGHLRKDPGQTHCTDPVGNLSARDVTLYKPTGQVVDFIVSAGFGPGVDNAVCWNPGPEGEYGPDKWFAPVNGDGTDPEDGIGSQTQADRIEALCAQTNLFVSNMNDQLNLMAGVVNELYATQALPLEGTLPRVGDPLTLTIKR